MVERLLDAVAQFRYPKDKLQIQVLDDSTDETSALIRKKAFELQQAGFTVEHIQRESRKGFKAGALSHALDSATGTFIAIFDADFLPRPDFLVSTLPAFSDQQVGMVQTRWEHLNKNHRPDPYIDSRRRAIHRGAEHPRTIRDEDCVGPTPKGSNAPNSGLVSQLAQNIREGARVP